MAMGLQGVTKLVRVQQHENCMQTKTWVARNQFEVAEKKMQGLLKARKPTSQDSAHQLQLKQKHAVNR